MRQKLKARPETRSDEPRRRFSSEAAEPSSRRLSHRHADDDEDLPPRRRSSSRDEDDDDIRKPMKGWGAFEKNQAVRESTRSLAKDFYLTETMDEAIIQIISEPLMVDTHSVKIDGNFDNVVCQYANQKYCLMCRDKMKVSERVALKVLDYRGEWDKDAKKFKKGTDPVEKVFLMNSRTAETYKDFCDKKGLDRANCVVEVSRSGSGTSTIYTFAEARDPRTDEKMRPKRYTSTLPDLEEIYCPLTDEALNKKYKF